MYFTPRRSRKSLKPESGPSSSSSPPPTPSLLLVAIRFSLTYQGMSQREVTWKSMFRVIRQTSDWQQQQTLWVQTISSINFALPLYSFVPLRRCPHARSTLQKPPAKHRAVVGHAKFKEHKRQGNRAFCSTCICCLPPSIKRNKTPHFYCLCCGWLVRGCRHFGAASALNGGHRRHRPS